MKEELYAPLNKISTISTNNTTDQFTFREISNSIESIMLKFEDVKNSVSDHMSDSNKEHKLFKSIECELADTMSSLNDITQNESLIEN